MWASFVFLFLAALFAAGYYQHRREVRGLHAKAIEQFINTKSHTSLLHLSFNGAEASIIDEKVEWSRFEGTTHYFLTVYATNQFGEYFVFRTNYDKPILKHIDHEMAKAILKSKYKPPNAQRQSESARQNSSQP